MEDFPGNDGENKKKNEDEFLFDVPPYTNISERDFESILDDYDQIFGYYVSSHLPELIPYLFKIENKFPKGVDLDNLEEKIIDFFTDMYDFEDESPNMHEITFYGGVLSILRVKEIMADKSTEMIIREENSKEELSDLFSAKFIDNDTKIKLSGIIEEYSGYKPLSLDPMFADMEIDMITLEKKKERYRENEIGEFTSILKDEVVNYIGGSIIQPEITEDMVDDMIRYARHVLVIFFKDGLLRTPDEMQIHKKFRKDKLLEEYGQIIEKYDKHLGKETLTTILLKIAEDYRSFYEELDEELRDVDINSSIFDLFDED